MLTLTRIKINDVTHEVAGDEITYNEVVTLAGYLISGKPSVQACANSEDFQEVAENECLTLHDNLLFTVSYTNVSNS